MRLKYWGHNDVLRRPFSFGRGATSLQLFSADASDIRPKSKLVSYELSNSIVAGILHQTCHWLISDAAPAPTHVSRAPRGANSAHGFSSFSHFVSWLKAHHDNRSPWSWSPKYPLVFRRNHLLRSSPSSLKPSTQIRLISIWRTFQSLSSSMKVLNGSLNSHYNRKRQQSYGAQSSFRNSDHEMVKRNTNIPVPTVNGCK